MSNPSKDGRSINNASQMTSTMDPHYSSGVYNLAFYKLATTLNWNTKKAFQVMAHANDVYWTSTSTFNAGACGVEKAATDYGYGAAAVTAAFSAVGVSCAGTVPSTTVLVSGTPQKNIAVGTGATRMFSLSVPFGKTSLTIKLSGGTGNGDLYVRAGTKPTTTSYTYRSIGSTNAETITIAKPPGATYFIMVHGKAAVSGAALVATFQ
jgi:pseudolysin/vibriolysin